MAIGTDAAVNFFGTQDTLGGTATAAISDAAFSVINATTGLNSWTNDDDAPTAGFVLEFTTATTGDAGSVINLYAKLLNIGDGGTEDTEDPDANFLNYYLGSFPHNNPSTGAQTAMLTVALPNMLTSQQYEFFIENTTGQTISAGWDLHVTPITIGPHA